MSEEARKNLTALGIVGGVLALLAGFVMWPSLILGVDRAPLAESVASVKDGGGALAEDHHGRCTDEGETYRCVVGIGASDVRWTGYDVDVSRTGCWNAVSANGGEIDGCVRLWDYFSAE